MSAPRPTRDELLAAALAIESPERRAEFLDSACADDLPLRRELEARLQAQASPPASPPNSDSQPPTQFDATLAPDGGRPNLNAAMNAGLSPAFHDGWAVVVGNAGVSVLRRFDQTIDVPRVMLREPSTGPEPIVRPRSAETPADAGDGRYRLDGEIARGGMGAILKGRDTDLGRELAIKVLLDQHKDRPEVVQRFIEEAQIGGQLQHPGIAPVYELGQFADRRPFFSMKLVKGETLSKLLADRPAPSADGGRMVGVFLQVCQTMAYAHSRGVIHRDLKPANIMVGAFGEVQVMDWGLAKVLSGGGVADEKKARATQPDGSFIRTVRSPVADERAPSFASIGSVGSAGSQTQMGSVMGTPAYMPPEQALGEIDHLDERADVFSLGAILCEILTGRPPYVGDDGTQVFRMATRGKLQDCFTRLDASGADPDLIALARHCLEASPVDRPRDASVVAARVAGYLESVETKLRSAEICRAAEAARAEEALHTVAETEARSRAERRARRLQLTLAAAAVVVATLGGAWMARTAVVQSRLKNAALAAERSADQARLAAVDAARREQRLAQVARASEQRETQLRQQAEVREQTVQETLYAAQMNLAGNAAEELAGLRRAAQIVDYWAPANAPRDLRGWEWSFLDSLRRSERLSVPHSGPISVRWSRDGRSVYCGGRDSRIRILEASSGRQTAELIGHSNYVHDVAVSPDGSRIASACRDQTVRIWDAATGRPTGVVVTLPESVEAVGWSPDGASVAFKANRELVVCNAATGERTATWAAPPGETFSLHWNPRTSQLTCSSGVVDATTGMLLWRTEGTESDWSPDGQKLAVCVGGEVQILAAADGARLATLTGHVDEVNAVRWSPTGEHLATAGDDSTVQVWRAADGRRLAVLRGHQHWVLDVDWSPDGRQLVSAGAEGRLKFWDWPAVSNPRTIASQIGHCQELLWDAYGDTLAVGADRIEFRDVGSGELRHTVDARTAWPDTVHSPALSWNSSRRLLAAHRGDKTVLLDDRTGELRQEIPDVDRRLCALELDPRGERVATTAWNPLAGGGDGGALRVYDVKTGRELWNTTSSPGLAGSLRWNADGSRIACGRWGDLLVVDGADGTVLKQIIGSYELGWIYSIAWNPSGDRLAIAYMNHQIRVVDVASGRETQVLVGHTAAAKSVAWHPDGDRIVSCGDDGTVRIWNAVSGAQMLVFRTPEKILEAATWSPDGAAVAVADAHGAVQIWDAGASLSRDRSPRLLARLDRRIAEDPERIEDRRMRIAIHERAGNRQAAAEDRRFVQQRLEKRLADDPTNADAARDLAELLAAAVEQPGWRPLEITASAAEPDGKLQQLPDGSLLSEADGSARKGGFRLVGRSPVRRVTALRLETLPHPSLPNFGQGWDSGNFHLSEVRVEVRRAGEAAVPIGFQFAASDRVREAGESTTHLDGPWATVDGDPQTTWDVWPQIDVSHALTLEPTTPVELAESDELIVRLDSHRQFFWHARLGRFRLAVTSDPYDGAREQILAAVRTRSTGAFEALAGAWLVAGRPERAERWLEASGPSTEPDAAFLRAALRARVFAQLGDREAAERAGAELTALFAVRHPPRALQGLLMQTALQHGGVTLQQLGRHLRQPGAAAELARLEAELSSDLSSAENRNRRAVLRARRGLWRESAEDYAELVRREPTNRLRWGVAATPLIMAGDVEGYRRHCRAMVEQFRGTTAADVADTVCKTSLLLPGVVEPTELPLKVLREGAADPAWAPYRPWFVACCALASLREDDAAEALKWTDKMPILYAQPGALALAVRALAHERLGKRQEALEALEAAEALIPRELRTLGAPDTTDPELAPAEAVGHDWLVAEILRREAAKQIQAAPRPSP